MGANFRIPGPARGSLDPETQRIPGAAEQPGLGNGVKRHQGDVAHHLVAREHPKAAHRLALAERRHQRIRPRDLGLELACRARRDGDRLILDERFLYSDGSTQQRVWTLTPDGPNRWRGTAADVVGEAVGELAGNALRWRYQLNLPVDGTNYVVTFDDWMYLMDEDTLINRSSMLKLGIELGQVTLFFRRQP